MAAAPKLIEIATPPAAILMIVSSGLLFTFLDTSAKYLVLAGMAPAFVTWVRFATHLVLVLLVLHAWSNPAMFRAQSLPKQIVRGVFLFGSTIFNFLALQTLQLAENIAISYFSPMLITALAGPLLGEWAGWRRWMAILVGFAGVVVVTRPGVESLSLAHVFAITSTLSYSLYVIMTRSMSSGETSDSLIFYSALTPVIFMSPAVPLAGSVPPSAWHFALLLGLGFFGGFGHWLIIRAYRIATTSALAPYPYLNIVWMTIAGYLVFDQLPDRWTIAGAAIIVASGLYIVYREHVLRLKSRSAPNTEDEELAKKL